MRYKNSKSKGYVLFEDYSGCEVGKSNSAGKRIRYFLDEIHYGETKSLFDKSMTFHYTYRIVENKSSPIELENNKWRFERASDTEKWYSELEFLFYDPRGKARFISYTEVKSWSFFNNQGFDWEKDNMPFAAYVIAIGVKLLSIVRKLDDWDHYDSTLSIKKQRDALNFEKHALEVEVSRLQDSLDLAVQNLKSGVEVTTKILNKQLSRFEKEIINLSEKIPISD